MGHSLGAAVTMQLLNDQSMDNKIDKCLLVDYGVKHSIFSQQLMDNFLYLQEFSLKNKTFQEIK